MPSLFRLNGVKFPILQAQLKPFFSDDDGPKNECMVWHLAILAKGTAPMIEGERGRDWKIGLQSDPGELLRTKPGELRSWLDLAGREGAWTEREDERGEPHALLSLFECEPVYACRWRLQAYKDRLRLHLEAKVDPHVGEGWMEDLELVVDTPLVLGAIPFGRRRESTCRAQIKRFGLKDEFEFHSDEGVSRLRLVRAKVG
jgi:hypothetical protein